MGRIVRRVRAVLFVYDDYTETPVEGGRCTARVYPEGTVLYRTGGYYLILDCPAGELTVELQGEWYQRKTLHLPERQRLQEIRTYMMPSGRYPLGAGAAVLYGRHPGKSFTAAVDREGNAGRLAADYEKGQGVICLYQAEGLVGRRLGIRSAEGAEEIFGIKEEGGLLKNEFRLDSPLKHSYRRRDSVICKISEISPGDGENYFAAFRGIPGENGRCLVYTGPENCFCVPLKCGCRSRFDFVTENMKNELTNSNTDNIL